MILQTDKTSLEIQTALLAGKQILLKYNNQIIGKIVDEKIAQAYYDQQQQYYYISYWVNINKITCPFQTINESVCLYNHINDPYASVAEAKASTNPVYLYFLGEFIDPGSSQ